MSITVFKELLGLHRLMSIGETAGYPDVAIFANVLTGQERELVAEDGDVIEVGTFFMATKGNMVPVSVPAMLASIEEAQGALDKLSGIMRAQAYKELMSTEPARDIPSPTARKITGIKSVDIKLAEVDPKDMLGFPSVKQTTPQNKCDTCSVKHMCPKVEAQPTEEASADDSEVKAQPDGKGQPITLNELFAMLTATPKTTKH